MGHVMNVANNTTLISVFDNLKLSEDDRAKFYSYGVLMNEKTHKIIGKMNNVDKEC